MGALAWVRNDGLETVDGLLVLLLRNEDQTSIIKITQNIHRLSLLLEASYWMLDNRQCMLIALSLDAKFSEVLVQRTTNLLIIIPELVDQLLESLDAIDCFFLSQQNISVDACQIVEFAHL